MDPESNDLLREGVSPKNMGCLPTFQDVAQINSIQQTPFYQLSILQVSPNQSPVNSMKFQASPINPPQFLKQSEMFSLQDEEDIALVNLFNEPHQFSQPIWDVSHSQLQPKTELDLTDQQKYKRKKVGCSCTKRKCFSKYCFCAKDGFSCSNLCKCVDCSNNKSFMSQQNQRSNVLEKKGCKCKKNFCQKGYCDCFAKGVLCNSLCKCCQCKNISTLDILKDRVPITKKKIKKCSKFYQNKKGFVRTYKKRLILTQVKNQ